MKLLKNDFIRFLMAGGVNTLIGYSVTLLLFYAVGLNYALAQILQFILCFPIAYTLQSRFAFRAAWSLKRMFLYPLSSVPNWIIQIATVVLAVEIFRIEEYIAYLISYVVAIPVMFFVVRGIVRPAQKNKNVFTKGGFLRGYLLPYTVFFAGLFFLGFYDFFIEQHKTLIWSVDGLYQHYPFFVDTGRKMAALFSDPLSVSFFDVHYGLGEGVVSALGYYTLGDPIALITAWIGQATDFRTLYEVGIVLRYYLVGLSFLWYLKYLKIKPIAALAGSMVYVFNGHMVFWGIRHPFFINPAILLPLAYVGIEQIFRKRDSRLFVFSVFASAFSNFYFFYMNTIGMGLYALVRYFHYKRRKDVSMGWFVKTFSIRYLLGLMASSVLFLPMIKSFFDLSRDPGVAFDYGLYQKSFLEKTARLFTLAWDDDLVPIALLSISLIAMIFLLFHRSKRWKNFKGLILIYLVIYQIPYAYSLLNGLSYPQLRWIYLLAGMAGLSVAVFVQECNDLKKKEGFSLGLSLFLYLFIVWYYRSDANQTALIIGFFLFLLILMRGLGKRVPKTVRTLFPAVLLLLIALEAAVTMNHLLAEDRYGAEFETKASLQSYYDGDLQGAIDALRPEEDFYRIEVVKQDRNNLPVYYGYPSTALYNSMTNGRVIDWLFERNVGSNVLRSGYNGFDGIAAYQSFLGVKYQIIDEDEAAKPLYGSVYKRTINGYAIYQNPFAGPPAFVVGENDAGKEGFFWEMDQEGVDFQVSDVKDISLNDRTILVEEKEGFVEFILADVKEKELYFQLKNVYHEDPSKSFAVTIEEVGENNEKTREIRNRENQYYMGVHDMTMNLGASDEKERTFRLFFSKEGSYTVDSLFFSAVDWKEQVEKFEKILDKGAKHFVFEGDRMEASFDVEGPDATAVFPIPYSEGWQAEVNGVKTKPLAWQEAFIGVPVEQGNTLVTLTYRTPGLRTGAVLSVFALLGIYGLIRTENRRRNKKPS